MAINYSYGNGGAKLQTESPELMQYLQGFQGGQQAPRAWGKQPQAQQRLAPAPQERLAPSPLDQNLSNAQDEAALAGLKAQYERQPTKIVSGFNMGTFATPDVQNFTGAQRKAYLAQNSEATGPSLGELDKEAAGSLGRFEQSVARRRAVPGAL